MVNSTHASPNAHLAVVDQVKITEYLLNPEHPDNGGKAAFFIALDFSRSEWEIFANALGRVALTADVTESMETVHGKKYIVDGELGIRQAKRLGCVRFGLSMPEQIFRGW